MYLEGHSLGKQIFVMAKPNSKAVPVGKARNIKPASPKKAKQAPNMRNKLNLIKEKPSHTICVHGFQDPLCLEMYEYTVTANKSGFLNNFRKWTKGEMENESLTEANFIGLKMQRNFGLDGNESWLYDDGYARLWMIRYPPENASTVDTRREGLRVLKTFFMSKQGSAYPPTNIDMVDITTNVPAVLEKCFLDDAIDEIIKTSFDLEELNDEFYEKYTAFARTIYSEKEPSDYAQSILGFPSLTPE